MKEEECVAFYAPIFFIQLLDSLLGQPQQCPVLRHCFRVCVPEISQQTEVQVLVPICQKTNFKRLDQVLDVFSAREHGRDHHQCSRFRRNSFTKVHSRQHVRLGQ